MSNATSNEKSAPSDKHEKPDKPDADLPPVDERLRRITNLLYPRVMRYRERVTDVRFASAPDEAALYALKGRRVLFLPNHPTVNDPPVMVGLSRLLDEPFRYAAMEELFEGPVGVVAARMGAFPIRRGTPDRAALKKCQASLLIPGGKLVLFAEGEAHGTNDNLLPLNPGGAQVAFWAAEKLRDDHNTAPDLLIQPVAIKYRFVEPANARREIEQGLAHAERALGLPALDPADSLFRRTRRASLAILSGIEREYDLKTDEKMDTDDRLTALYNALEARVIAMLRIPAPKEENMVHRMRTLFNAAHAYRARLETGETQYDKRLQERREWIADACLADLRRVENFMGVRTRRIEPDATLEQLDEMLVRLEAELFGDKRTRPLRDATVALGAPIDVREQLPVYTANKRRAVIDVTRRVEGELRAMLDGMHWLSTAA